MHAKGDTSTISASLAIYSRMRHDWAVSILFTFMRRESIGTSDEEGLTRSEKGD